MSPWPIDPRVISETYCIYPPFGQKKSLNNKKSLLTILLAALINPPRMFIGHICVRWACIIVHEYYSLKSRIASVELVILYRLPTNAELVTQPQIICGSEWFCTWGICRANWTKIFRWYISYNQKQILITMTSGGVREQRQQIKTFSIYFSVRDVGHPPLLVFHYNLQSTLARNRNSIYLHL